MTVTVASSNWLVPNNWRTTLEPRVANFSTPELDEALCVIKTVLEGRSDAEIQSLALSLVHLVAPDSTIELKGVPLGFVFEPRIVFLGHGDEAARQWFAGQIHERHPRIKIIQPQPGLAVEA